MFGMIGNETFIVLIDFNDISNHETRMLDMYIYIMIFQLISNHTKHITIYEARQS
jgi:hypothetical protein